MGQRHLQALFQRFSQTLGMWTIDATFSEACAFVSGFDAATDGGLLDGFQPWLVDRTESDRPELAWMSLVFRHAFPSERPSVRAMTSEEDEVATAALFSLLDEYLALGNTAS